MSSRKFLLVESNSTSNIATASTTVKQIEGDGVAETLRKHEAKLHNSCKLEFSKSRLERKRKIKAATYVVIPEKSERKISTREVTHSAILLPNKIYITLVLLK